MTTKIIAGTYTNGYTLASKYAGISITSPGSIASPPGANGVLGFQKAAAAGVALTLPKGGDLAKRWQYPRR
jgi:hypothetical protein